MNKETRDMIEGLFQSAAIGMVIVFVIFAGGVAWMVYDMTSK